MSGSDPLATALLALRAKAATPAELRLLELVPASVQARARLGERDEAVRAAFAAVPHLPPTEAARHVARELARYLASAWMLERDRPQDASPAPPLRAALRRVARSNDGRPLSPVQLGRIRRGERR